MLYNFTKSHEYRSSTFAFVIRYGYVVVKLFSKYLNGEFVELDIQ